MMLQTIRERSSGLVLWVIVILITLSFALWGVSSYFQTGGNTAVIKINGDEVTLQNVTSRIQQRRSQVEREMPVGSRGLNSEQSAQIQKEVIDTIINEELERQWAIRSGVVVSDLRLAQYIKYEVPAFQNDGRFDVALYKNYVRNQRYPEAYFENFIVRPALSIDEMRQAVLMSGFETPALTQAAWERENQEREISYAMIAADKFRPEISIDEAVIAAFYESSAQRYTSPEQVRLEYVELDAETLLNTANDQLVISPEDIAARYEIQRDSFASEETRRARHILIKVEPNASDATAKDAESKINKIRAEIVQGILSFEDAARDNSDDTMSAQEGGDLGFFGRGMMVPEFEEAAFALSAGDLSTPVKSQFGYHLLRLEEIRPASVKSLEEVSASIERDLKLEKAQLLLVDKADLLANLVWEAPESLEKASKELGLEIQQTEFLTRNDLTGVFQYPAVLEAAFSSGLIDSRSNSDVILVSNDKRIVIRIKDYQPATQKTLDEVHGEILDELVSTEATRRAALLADEMIAAVAEGQTMEVWASEKGLPAPVTVSVSRTDRQIPAEIIKGAFALLPTENAAATDKTSVQMSNGDMAVIQLLEVKAKSVEELSASELRDYQQMVSFTRGAEELNAVKVALRELAKIVIKEDRI